MEGAGSMVGNEGDSVTGVTAGLQKLNSQAENTEPDKTVTNQNQSQPQAEHQQAMDDFLEQIFNMPSWSDVDASGKAPWDYSTMALDSSQNNQKLFIKSLMGSGGQGMMSDFSLEDPLLACRLQQQLSNENLLGPSERTRSMATQLGTAGENASSSQLLAGIGSPGLLTEIRSPASGSTAVAAADTVTVPSPTQSWRPPYVGLNPVPLSLGQTKVDTARLLGKRLRDAEAVLTRPANTAPFTNFTGGGIAVGSNNGQAGQQSSYELALSQPQAQSSPPPGIVAAPAPAPARPRVRARRGQATDPHSIAERQRRERIAERMKALQELVPNCSKTDKAAMLDEIIEYVKFLQLQVKVLSMSRLGGAGAVGQAIADISADASSSMQLSKIKKGTDNICRDEEGSSITEGEVAKLMDENMGSAMQFLQSKGLCLMPLSLATTISGRSMQPNALVRSPCGSNQVSNSPQPSESKSRSKEGTV